MDILCTRCAEPYDIDHLHDLVGSGGLVDSRGAPHTFATLYAEFRRRGCIALGGRQCSRHLAANALFEIAELAGDDVDFYASMCEDLLE